MRYTLLLFAAVILAITTNLFSQTPTHQGMVSDTTGTTWFLNRTDSIGGFFASPLTLLPSIISTPFGNAALFNGTNQALLINGNPIGTASAFTIEAFFRPDTSLAEGTNEQRFLHFRNLTNDNRRVLMEIRILPSQRWVLDTYIKSDTAALPNSVTLVDSNTTFATGQWYHVALVYDGSAMHQFVNGSELLSGKVLYKQIDLNGKVSIGARQDPRSWFKGAISFIKVTRKALPASEFTIPAITSTPDMKHSPKGMKLGQNYPNPFNPQTKIDFRVTEKSTVVLKIYDTLGNEIATLLNEEKPSGDYSVDFQSAGLTSGIYIYSLQTGRMIETKKLVLLK